MAAAIVMLAAYAVFYFAYQRPHELQAALRSAVEAHQAATDQFNARMQQLDQERLGMEARRQEAENEAQERVNQADAREDADQARMSAHIDQERRAAGLPALGNAAE